MNIKTRKLKGYIALTLLIVVCMLIASAMNFFAPNNDAEAITTANMDSQATNLGNLLIEGYENDTTGTGNVFDGDVFWKLVEMVSGGGSYNKNNIDTLSAVKTSADFRSKNDGKDVVVTIDGKQWIATYLSTAADGPHKGDPILTFWLANNATASTWSDTNNYKNYWGKQYTSNLYGTSYMRAVTLNNSDVDENGNRTGKCEYAATNTSTSSVQSGTMDFATQKTTGDWAIYTATNAKGSLVDFIEVPKNMSWQLNQTAVGTVTSSAYTGSYNYNNNNDALSAGGTVSSATNGDYLSQLTTAGLGTYYSKWGTDTLWLPSVTETGVSGEEGIWKASNNTRANSTYSWLRSANCNNYYYSYVRAADGSSMNTYNVDYANAVRPAFHLNLKSASARAGSLGAELPF